MANALTYTEITELGQREAQVFVASGTDLAFSTTDLLVHANSAYQIVYEESGGAIVRASSASLWASGDQPTTVASHVHFAAPSGTAAVASFIDVFATTAVPLSISATTNTTRLMTSAALFGSVVEGMAITADADIAADTYVEIKVDNSNLYLSRAAIGSHTAARTFTPVGSPADVILNPVDYEEIQILRGMGTAIGTYSTPKVYAAIRHQQTTDTEANRFDLHWWPPVAGYYFPAHYRAQFDPFDGGASDVPDVNDIESYDIAYTLGAILAPLAGRAELVPSIIAKISREMQPKISRRLSAMFAANQDK